MFAAVIFWPSHAEPSDFKLHGFLQGNYSLNADRENPDGGDFKWAEERAQLKLDGNRGPYHLFIKADAFYDHADDRADAEIREGYADYTADKWDVRLGRQVITWGLGDMIFINDVFPKDYEAFFSGRPMEYLKKGVDGVKVGAYPSIASIELVVIPFFTPNNFPNQNRFWMFDPMPQVQNREEKEPSSTLENTETALRIYRTIAGSEVSLYAYRGFYRQPSMMPDNPAMPARLTLFYPELSVYGASLQERALDGLLSVEAGYYDSRQDRDGNDPMMPNSSSRALIGYQRQLWEDFTFGLQYYGEHTDNYSEYEKNLPQGFPKERIFKQLTSIRLTQLLMHQTLKLSFFSFYSPSDRDFMLNPEVKYNFTDYIWAIAGGNIFGSGESRGQFGQLDENDNAYLQIRYEF
ncbi:MAG: hypothetical protein Q8J64_01520 [Thermodesulfovibrionales bacterium]|nr:hypothetical protein [Thermodesulfovibrionales bacterium]